MNRPTCSNVNCPLASTLLDPAAPLCGYCASHPADRQPTPQVTLPGYRYYLPTFVGRSAGK
jgi:hypothetical protein